MDQWDKYDAEGRKFIKVGKSYIIYPDLPARHPNRRKIHVRGIVDDGIVVYRAWHTRHRCWCYNTEPFFYYGMLLESGSIKRG